MRPRNVPLPRRCKPRARSTTSVSLFNKTWVTFAWPTSSIVGSSRGGRGNIKSVHHVAFIWRQRIAVVVFSGKCRLSSFKILIFIVSWSWLCPPPRPRVDQCLPGCSLLIDMFKKVRRMADYNYKPVNYVGHVIIVICEYYTEHCSVGPTKLIETATTTASTRTRMRISKFRFLNLDF